MAAMRRRRSRARPSQIYIRSGTRRSHRRLFAIVVLLALAAAVVWLALGNW